MALRKEDCESAAQLLSVASSLAETCGETLSNGTDEYEDYFEACVRQIRAALVVLNPAPPKPSVEDTVRWRVKLRDFGDRKINVIKAIRTICQGMGLKEAKDFVERAPTTPDGETVLETQDRRLADSTLSDLRFQGATVDLRGYDAVGQPTVHLTAGGNGPTG